MFLGVSVFARDPGTFLLFRCDLNPNGKLTHVVQMLGPVGEQNRETGGVLIENELVFRFWNSWIDIHGMYTA